MKNRASRGDGDVDRPMTRVVERNIAALLERRREQEMQLGWQDRLADAVTRFAGSMAFVGIHVVVFGGWIAVNLGLVPGIAPFDPTFVALAMIASVEAIFLSTFILIAQNRMQADADRRADLNLQISLLAEHEITRLIKITTDIGRRMGSPAADHPELSELAKDVKPEAVLEHLEERQENERG
jgi:uncharacterized membrane protein